MQSQPVSFIGFELAELLLEAASLGFGCIAFFASGPQSSLYWYAPCNVHGLRLQPEIILQDVHQTRSACDCVREDTGPLLMR